VSRLPGLTYRPSNGRYTGPFVTFVKGFCGAIADYIEGQAAKPDKTWRGALHSLRTIERGSGVQIRDALRSLGIQAFKRSVAKVAH